MVSNVQTPSDAVVSESELDEASEKSVAALYARLDAEQKLKDKVRQEQRACFEETTRILGHKPPSPEQVMAATRRHEMLARIASLRKEAGFVGEAFTEDSSESTPGHRFAGGQVMSGGSPFGLVSPVDIVRNRPMPFYWTTVFKPPYRFKQEYPGFSAAVPQRGADMRTGRVFAKGDSTGDYDGYLGAAVGVRFSLPLGGPFGTPAPVGAGQVVAPPYYACQARVLAAMTGTKLWSFEVENSQGKCIGDVWFYPITARSLYDKQAPADSFGEWAQNPALHWKKKTSFPPDWQFPDAFDFSEYLASHDWPAPTALPRTATSPWFTVDNRHVYEIHVGVRVETNGVKPGVLPNGAFSKAIAKMEAVIDSITVEFTG